MVSFELRAVSLELNPTSLRLLAAQDSKLGASSYFSFGGSVRPKTEIIPWPATFVFVSPGVGR
jgi:hypothetical protein